jgi:hypothetical protein
MWARNITVFFLFLVNKMKHFQETITIGRVNKLMEMAMKGSTS